MFHEQSQIGIIILCCATSNKTTVGSSEKYTIKPTQCGFALKLAWTIGRTLVSPTKSQCVPQPQKLPGTRRTFGNLCYLSHEVFMVTSPQSVNSTAFSVQYHRLRSSDRKVETECLVLGPIRRANKRGRPALLLASSTARGT